MHVVLLGSSMVGSLACADTDYVNIVILTRSRQHGYLRLYQKQKIHLERTLQKTLAVAVGVSSTLQKTLLHDGLILKLDGLILLTGT